MELNAEQIKKQMQDWSNGICENACLKGEFLNGIIVACENCMPNTVRNALALINSQEQRIKDLASENVQFRHEQGKLIVERNTFREYAYNMQKYVESIKHKEEEGYEPSAARDAAEMEMWHRVALRTKRLEDENAEQEKAIINALERMREIRRETKSDTVRKMQTEINKTLSALCKGDVSEIRRMIDQIAKEMLEEGECK